MRKRILSVLLIIATILSLSSTAFAFDTGIECSGISFVDAEGAAITALTGEPVTAKVTVSSNTSGKKPVLVVCSFEKGMLSNVWYQTAAALTGEISVPFTPEIGENTVIKASVFDGLKTLNNPTATAEALKESTELSKIFINGEPFEEYSEDITEYEILVPAGREIDIKAIAKDGGTNVEIEQGTGLPQESKIKLTSASGVEKTIDMIFYSDELQLCAPKKISYEVDGVEYELNFDPSVYEYNVVLPDNTFYVTLNAEALNATKMDMRVQDVDHSEKLFNEVTYLPGAMDSTATETFNDRPMRNNLVPIKNEETKAIINCEYNGSMASYTINFSAKQPRLTRFDIPEAVKDKDKYLPGFFGGAAANNDNGSLAGVDRAYAFANISENLLGSSLFAITNYFDRKAASNNDWIEKNTSGEYFSFTADTSGTLYFLIDNEITNDEWDIQTGEFAEDGKWRLIGEADDVTIPDGYTSLTDKSLPRDYSPSNGETYANVIEWSRYSASSPEKYKYDENALTKTLTEKVSTFDYVYARSFEAGEDVTIYHPGKTTIYKALFVKWDVQ